jgi:hypothetical protein
MTGTEFEAAFRKLLASEGNKRDSTGCIACERCVGATDSTFSVDCAQITRCHYCTKCERCTDCSHCSGSRDLNESSHCIDSERCSRSAQLVRCVGCVSCTYCFGCVGLARKDFHILNQPYDRTEYFAVVERLKRELRIR